MKKVYIIHTNLVSYEELNKLFYEIVADVKVFNIIDDSLLHDVMENGGINSKIISRVSKYFKAAEENGADLIFNQCSSIGEASDVAANLVNIPVLKVDEAMCLKAVEIGQKIGVVATVKSTMKPSTNLVKNKAMLINKKVEVVEYLVDGALDVLMKEKNREKHNNMVLEKISEAEKNCDVIVLAQGSMTVLLNELKNTKVPVLTSPRMGVEKARDILSRIKQ